MQFAYPKIKSHGQVVRLPDAVEQPRAGSKISVDITVVSHGCATPIALSDVEYRRHLDVDANPNTQLVRELCDAGVEVVVRGPAWAHMGFSPDGVKSDIKIAVSALTANVNRQADGYALVQLK